MKVKCKKCGEVIEGDKVGGEVTCKCKALTIIEGEDYYRIAGNPDEWEKVEENEDE